MDKQNDNISDQVDDNFILQEQTRLLFQNTTVAIAVNLSIAFLTYLAIPSPQHYWLWPIIGVSGLRFVFYFWCKDNSNLPNHRIIFLIIIFLTTLQGATWGVASILLYASASDLHKFYLIAIICGMSGGAILTLSPSLLAFTCFTLPSVLPLVLTLILESDETLKHAGYMGFVFIIAVHLLARRINISNVELLQSHRHLELTGQELARHKDRLEVLVEERTKELKESRENYRRLIEEINDVIFELDSDGTIKYISPVITLILGHKPENLIGTLFVELIYPEDLSTVTQRLLPEITTENLKPVEFRILDSTARPHWVRTSMRPILKNSKPIGFRGVLNNIENEKQADREKKILLQRFYENQKLEAIGTLAGGIAHDFNNLLMGIQGHASLLSVKFDASDPHLEHTKAIEELVGSATNLTSQLLGTVHGGKYNPKPANLNELIIKSSTLFNRTRKEIIMSRNMSEAPVVAEVDIQQIEQVLLNLYLNSWEAMPDGGEIRLESSRITLDDSFCEPYQVPPGEYARISVADSGIGMDEATRQRVFDPFFTTKGKDRGTGLGLASSYGIIHNHGGFITIDSTEGQGTTVTLYLPLSDKEPCRLVWTAKEPVKTKNSEIILLVDDEELILNVGKALLENLGYEVIVAGGGEEAIEYIKKEGENVSLVLLDMVMPKMDGGMTFEEIRKLYPSMPVILSSGYSLDGQATQIIKRGCNGFLQKPFSLSELSRKIRTVLDGEENIIDG